MLAREYKKYGLTAAKKSIPAHKSWFLATTVVVTAGGVRRPVYIRFTEEFVKAIGYEMQYGVSVYKPCYLRLNHLAGTKEWRLFAFYVGSKIGKLILKYDHRPAWSVPKTRLKDETNIEDCDADCEGSGGTGTGRRRTASSDDPEGVKGISENRTAVP